MYIIALYEKARKPFLVHTLIIKFPHRVQNKTNDYNLRQNYNFGLKDCSLFNHKNITHLSKHVSLGTKTIVLAYDPDPTIHGAYVSVLVLLVNF